MDKMRLKRIAVEWASGILYHGTGSDSFIDEGLTSEEENYIIEHLYKVALRLNNGNVPATSLTDVIEKYYTFE